MLPDCVVYYRLETYGQPEERGASWKKQEGSLKNIAVGADLVVGTDLDDNIFIREGTLCYCELMTPSVFWNQESELNGS